MDRRRVLTLPAAFAFAARVAAQTNANAIPGTAFCASPTSTIRANTRLLEIMSMLTKSDPNWMKVYLKQEQADFATASADLLLDYRTQHLKALVEKLMPQFDGKKQ